VKPEFLDRLSKNILISNFTKIRPVEAQLFHANGRADMTILVVPFRNFAIAPEKVKNFNCVT